MAMVVYTPMGTLASSDNGSFHRVTQTWREQRDENQLAASAVFTVPTRYLKAMKQPGYLKTA
jgi:hypothetical protein